MRAWRLAHPEEAKKRDHARKLSETYGLTVSRFTDMLLAQAGRCDICGDLPCKRGLFVDHDHKTDRVRALLCKKCNSALGLLREDERLFLACIEYLRRHRLKAV